ncbi:ACP phosphodiesterase [Vibrio alginolyticus]
MNFLAHLHIADHCSSHLLGNLLGDFVKGDPSKQYSAHISNGIKLHRFVDTITDQHPIVEECKPLFTGVSRRFAPIALDMFWDHCLAKHWLSFHDQPLNRFVNDAYQIVDREVNDEMPPRFLLLHSRMWTGGWLQSYQELDNIEFALHRMSKRSPRMANLATTFTVLENEYSTLEAHFPSLYTDVLAKAVRQHKQLVKA